MSEAQGHLPHRLSVVWFSDLVGWSSLAARDEDRAIALVRRFQAAVRAAVPPDSGRIVKFIGDAALVESPSAESALRSAVALRESMDASEAVRTGVHLGDVAIGADGDLYGDGVNTAQRIQTEAGPGQIVVSEDVARGLRSRPAFRFEPLGERTLKGVASTELYLVVGVDAPSGWPGTEPVPTAAEPAVARRSIAVLPFANLSADVENEYFSDGVTEEILTALTKLGGLMVISRTSAMQYKGSTKSIRQIGAELDVGSVLEGSVRRAGDRVRITAQLIEAPSDVHLWAETYDRTLDDIFAIQSDVAGRIVDALRVQLTPREKAQIAARPTESVEAYQWFLKGRHFLAKRTGKMLHQAIEWFQKAAEADPSFAGAWVGLADAHALLPSYSDTPAAEAGVAARSAAERALALDPSLGEAHAALGFVAQQELNWDLAEREYRSAIELSPGSASAHHWYGVFLSYQGRHDEAIDILRRALDMDPLSLPIHNGLGTAYGYARRYEEAIATYRKSVDLDASNLGSHTNLAETYDTLGRYEEALGEWDHAAALEEHTYTPALVAGLRSGFIRAGAGGYWEAWISGLEGRDGVLWLFHRARACAQLGRFDEAFGWLDQLIDRGGPLILQIRVDPVFDSLRSDPRFDAILQRVGAA